ncbi:hypothetical protein OIU85_020209 [Salix viminalis]|uniref:Uncharacterized protein n=1 Tax=Salix viminalis TaxID=40686 RepID=A0A9Q0UFM6_SALVM|nr:hypothetical protein OIU85_020209 [Salix viminalis]
MATVEVVSAQNVLVEEKIEQPIKFETTTEEAVNAAPEAVTEEPKEAEKATVLEKTVEETHKETPEPVVEETKAAPEVPAEPVVEEAKETTEPGEAAAAEPEVPAEPVVEEAKETAGAWRGTGSRTGSRNRSSKGRREAC